ncbi:hypothetical protein HELRODRAFT_83158 [Helobdella robusta]|uniref:Galactokinase n=1 Tax=Helobdella robusta TaxID=6412 RepID=T1G513_HELRO|nr:hypothetical protein HELRODRAFT_83158 [Helobdella robusta]ESO00380.1 hypothetical protein HELRODRAFT_83158 [Helobdella robusta]
MSLEGLVEIGSKEYKKFFRSDAELATFAPGRVNLIGEHTDYNDGFVFPMAIPLVTVMVGGRSRNSTCCIVTMCSDVDDPKMIEFSVDSIKALVSGYPKWANYVKGVLAFHPNKDKIPPFNVIIVSSVPCGGGLSSSAALEMAMHTFVDHLLEIKVNSVEYMKSKAFTCQKSEHLFANVPCGIMDQMISAMAKKDHAMLMDCRLSLDVKLINFPSENVSVLVTNSNVKHELSSGEYEVRRKQCEKAALLMNVPKLRDATLDTLQGYKEIFDDVTYRRAKHVISENGRCVQAANAIQNGQYKKFGKLMIESHCSLRDDYEVSCSELDELVKLAMEVDGVFGSRMTGGGFGGCTVTLLQKESVEPFLKHVQESYTGKASFYLCEPFHGAQEISL